MWFLKRLQELVPLGVVILIMVNRSFAVETGVKCDGRKQMDGTAVIRQSFCGSSIESPLPACERWLEETQKGLGEEYVRSVACALSSNDVKNCLLVAHAQVVCRFSSNLNLEPRSCLEHIGEVNRSIHDLKHCIGGWIGKEQGAISPDLNEIYECVSREDFSSRNDCIFDLAVKYKLPKLCLLNTDPYERYTGSDDDSRFRKSRPNCIEKAQQ